MKVLIVYGTTEGHTRKIAAFAADRLRSAGDEAIMIDANDVPWNLLIRDYDAVIVAASVHNEQYQASVIQFARHYYERLNAMPSLFLSVSLSAASKDPQNMARLLDAEQQLKRLSGWNAPVEHVAGAIRFGEYDFFKSMVVRLLAVRKGVSGSTAAADVEFTDWEALAAVVDRFRASAVSRAHPP